MALSVTKIASGGYTIVQDTTTFYWSGLYYKAGNDGIDISSNELFSVWKVENILPAAWTVDGVTGFTTVQQVCDALDAIGVSGNVSTGETTLFSGTPYVQSVEITRPADTTAYDANDAINDSVHTAQVETITLTGTEGSGTITGAGGVTGDVSFITGLTETAAAYVTAYELDYASEGITLTSSGADIIMTSASAGVPFTAPVFTNVSGDLAGTVVHTTPNVTPGAFEFEQMAIANGGGGYIMDVKIESDMTTLAGTTVRVWLFNETPTGIIGDNVAFVNAYADKDKRIGYIDVEMDALLGSSTSVIGQVSVIKEYKCADTSLFALVQTITGFTPTSAGKLDIMFNVLKLS